MDNYQIVGTFSVQAKKTEDGKHSFTATSKNPPTKQPVSNQPLDITSSYTCYQPINLHSTYSEYRGMIWGKIDLAAGDIWPDWDGQRIIIEASPSRIIYMKYGGTSSQSIYIQPPRDFITNVTTDTFNRKAAEKTKLTKRLAEWEVHFLTGFLGAAHWAGLATVLGTDILQQVISERKRNTSYREAANDIIDVDKDLKEIAPVFRGKIYEALIGGIKSRPGEKTKTLIQTLPPLILKDDKTTGRIAGAIAAKFMFGTNNKIVTFFVLQTITTQIALKSPSKLPPAVGLTLQDSLKKLLPDIDKLDSTNPNDQKILIDQMVDLFQQLGVTVSAHESTTIADEIRRNPERISNNMKKLGNAFEKIVNADQAK